MKFFKIAFLSIGSLLFMITFYFFSFVEKSVNIAKRGKIESVKIKLDPYRQKRRSLWISIKNGCFMGVLRCFKGVLVLFCSVLYFCEILPCRIVSDFKYTRQGTWLAESFMIYLYNTYFGG